MIGMTYGYLVILKALSRCILPSSYMDLKLLSYRGSESLKSTLALNKPLLGHPTLMVFRRQQSKFLRKHCH